MSAILLDEFREVRELKKDDTLGTIVGRRKTLFAATATLVVATGMVATYRAAPLYEATSTIVFPLRTSSALTTAQSSLAGGALSGALGNATPLRQGQFLLESPTATLRVAEKLGVEPGDVEKSRRIDNNPSANALVVRATNEDPASAQKTCRLFIDALRTLTNATGDAGEAGDLRLLDHRIAATAGDLSIAQRELTAFQRGLVSAPSFLNGKAGVLVVPGPWLEEKRRADLELRQLDVRIAARRKNTNSAAKIASTDPTSLPTVRPLRDQLVALDLELRTARSSGGPQSPDVIRLTEQIVQTKLTLRRELDAYMRAFHADVADANGLSLVLDRIATDARARALDHISASAPGEAARYQALLDRVSTANETLDRLKSQRLGAELSGESDPNRWAVLDDATMRDRPINKSYSTALILYGPLGLLAASVVAFVADRRRRPN